ncbi:MAG: hypothetical protein I8H91_03110 [Burkholderiales bacterium]|nr:hypothetical protein [Burkholderiales bacterium]
MRKQHINLFSCLVSVFEANPIKPDFCGLNWAWGLVVTIFQAKMAVCARYTCASSYQKNSKLSIQAGRLHGACNSLILLRILKSLLLKMVKKSIGYEFRCNRPGHPGTRGWPAPAGRVRSPRGPLRVPARAAHAEIAAAAPGTAPAGAAAGRVQLQVVHQFKALGGSGIDGAACTTVP